MMFQVFFLRFIARKVSATDEGEDSARNSGRSTDQNSQSNFRSHNQSQVQSQSHILKVYNSSLGRPTAAMHSVLKEEYDSIMKVSNYEEFFRRVNLYYTPEHFTSMLRNAVRESVKKSYTSNINLSALGGLDLEPIPDYASHLNSSSAFTPQESVGIEGLRKNIVWGDVWKMYSSEKASGNYDLDNINGVRRKVFESKKQNQKIKVEFPNRRNSYHSTANKAINNYNVMQRSGSGHHLNGKFNQSVNGNNSRYPYREQISYKNNNSHSNSYTNSNNHVVSSALNNPQPTPNPQMRRNHGSSNSLSSLLHPSSSTAASNNSNGNNSNSNSNSNGNKNAYNGNSSNKNKGKVSHKNSTMNNAMSVSGDRVRLHVFYQVSLQKSNTETLS